MLDITGSNLKNEGSAIETAPVYSWREEEYLKALGTNHPADVFELEEITEETLEVVRAEVEKKEFALDKEGMSYSWVVLLLLLMVQISN